MSRITLVLGGAGSGKSRFAETLASPFATRGYIATAQALDEEMRARIARHRLDRGERWTTREAPLNLVAAVDGAAEAVILIDCLTLWISNLMHAGRDVGSEVDLLCAALQRRAEPTVVVSNEVGQGIVPDNALARRFRDAQGLANQRLAEIADSVVMVMAGLPLVLKGGSPRPAPPETAR